MPCGKCVKCRRRRISGWSFRLRMQEKIAHSAYFLTLTYNNESLPFSQNGFSTLVKKHLQLFFKRLRECHIRAGFDGVRSSSSCDIQGGESLKYYAVGEYGGRSKRPHYHVILFNAELSCMFSKDDLKALYWTDLDGKLPVNCFSWQLGHCTVGRVTGASVGYCLKYMCKKSKIPEGINDDRVREFSLMSKGLGKNYITPDIIKYHMADLNGHASIIMEDGRRIAMPRYYKKFIYQNLTIEQIHEMKQYWKDRLEDECWKAAASSRKRKTVREHLAAVEAAAAAFDKQGDHGTTL